MSVEKEIQAAIKKNMPAQVGDNLKVLLAEGEKAKQQAIEWKNEYDDVIKENRDLVKENDELKKLKHTAEALDKREAELNEKERQQEVEMLKVKLEEANSRANMVKEFTSGLVRNTNFRKNYYHTEDELGRNDSNTGQWIDPKNKTISGNQDITED
jgi:hypothetical protein